MPNGPGYTRAGEGLILTGDESLFQPRPIEQTVQDIESEQDTQRQLAKLLMAGGGYDGYDETAAGPATPDINALGRPARSTGLRSFADISRSPLGAIGLSMVPGGSLAGAVGRTADISDFARAYGYQEPTFRESAGSFFGGDYRGDVSQDTAVAPNQYGAATASDLAAALAAAQYGPGAQQAAIDRAFISGDVGHPGMGAGPESTDYGYGGYGDAPGYGGF